MDTLRALDAELKHIREEKDFLQPFVNDDSPYAEKALKRLEQREHEVENTIANEEAILADMWEDYEQEQNVPTQK